MDDGKEARGHDREDRHRFGDPVDGGTEPGAEEEEDGGDERARVRDADPEDEVGDEHPPADRPVEAGVLHAEADDQRPAIGADSDAGGGERDERTPAETGRNRKDFRRVIKCLVENQLVVR